MTSSTILQAPTLILRPVLDAFLALPTYIQVLSVVIGVPALAIALNVFSQLVRVAQNLDSPIQASANTPSACRETRLCLLWSFTSSPGLAALPRMVRTHTSSSLRTATRSVPYLWAAASWHGCGTEEDVADPITSVWRLVFVQDDGSNSYRCAWTKGKQPLARRQDLAGLCRAGIHCEPLTAHSHVAFTGRG